MLATQEEKMDLNIVTFLRFPRCKRNFYNLDARNPAGCSPCFCYGHSAACVSADNHSVYNITSTFQQGEVQAGYPYGSWGCLLSLLLDVLEEPPGLQLCWESPCFDGWDGLIVGRSRVQG